MKLPGFTAERSLYGNEEIYCVSEYVRYTDSVIPQQSSWTETKCKGVVQLCKDCRISWDSGVPATKCSDWYACGVCIGWDW